MKKAKKTPKEIKTEVEDKLRPTVMKAIREIRKKYAKNSPDRLYTVAFLSGRTVVIPEQRRNVGGSSVDTADLARISIERLKARKRPFDGILMYKPLENNHIASGIMCSVTRATFERFKKKNPDFHCIVANSLNKFKLYKGRKEWNY